MKFLLCNGSPRGKNGNSGILVDALAKGLSEHADVRIEKALLNRIGEHEQTAGALAAADCAIIVFPLYTDAMPGMTMAFFEKLAPYIGSLNDLHLGFVVQSGFPEKIQSRAVEKYLERLTGILGAQYSGTAIFGGGMSMGKNRLKLARDLGKTFLPSGTFDPALLAETSRMEKLSPRGIKVMRLITNMPLIQIPWIRQLRVNGSFKRRNDRPYA
ncbi:MAG: NAD(P)H-dependent oxidoreductase [Clostridiales bacterium]|nr:NAD(P)H-dependent oxidoreductase [Clostridiales bacterium]